MSQSQAWETLGDPKATKEAKDKALETLSQFETYARVIAYALTKEAH